MSRIDITSTGAPLSDGILQTANPLDATLQVVTDNVGNSSTVSLSTTETQINSILRIKTDNAELLDIENSSGNRFNINRVSQNINLDFASKPTDLTTQVGAIRTAIDGINLADVVKFQENGQVTITERLKLESDSTVTTQTSSVIQSSTANANLVIAPNGTGALIADIPDGTAAGGNARGANAVDLQTSRTTAQQVAAGTETAILSGLNNTIQASGRQGVIVGGDSNLLNFAYNFLGGGQNNSVTSASYIFLGGGASNTASSSYSTVSGGQSNTASTNTHATVVGGQGNTASGQYSVAGGQTGIASGLQSMAFNGTASGQSSVSLGAGNQATGRFTTALGLNSKAYLYNQLSVGSVGSSFGFVAGSSQLSFLVALTQGALLTGGTTVLTLDGDGGNLIIPTGTNRAWNVTSSWVAVVTAITGTATGISVGDVVTSVDLLGFKKVGGVSSTSTHTSAATKLMVTTPAAYAACSIAYTAGAVNQEMALTFTGPTFVGGGSVTMRIVSRIELSEVSW